MKTLSGQRRRLDTALGLVHSPGLVFLDEPSTGLDPQSRIPVLAGSLASVSYTAGLLTKSEDVLAPMLNMVMVPLMLLSGIGAGRTGGRRSAQPLATAPDAWRWAGDRATPLC